MVFNRFVRTSQTLVVFSLQCFTKDGAPHWQEYCNNHIIAKIMGQICLEVSRPATNTRRCALLAIPVVTTVVMHSRHVLVHVVEGVNRIELVDHVVFSNKLCQEYYSRRSPSSEEDRQD
jgi:hypothetical protein